MDKKSFHEQLGLEFDLILYYISGKIVSPLQKSVKEEGNTLMQLNNAEKNIIGILCSKGDTNITDLARFSNLSYKNMSKFLIDIENEGYIERYIDEKCRRNVLVRITEKGKKLHKEFLNSIYKKAEIFLDSVYTEDEQLELERLLKKTIMLLSRLDTVDY